MTFMNRFQHTATASASYAEAAFSCAKTARNHAIALILDATIVASVFVSLISLISLISSICQILVVILLAVLVISGKLNRCKRCPTA